MVACFSSPFLCGLATKLATTPGGFAISENGASRHFDELNKDKRLNRQPKKKKAKKVVFTVNFHFDGIFTIWPLKYCQGQLTLGIREIKSTQDIAEMMKIGYESGNEIDIIEESDDEYYGSDNYEEIENVDFQTDGDESVVIKSISTHDPFLAKLCSARIMFRGTAEHQQTEAPLADPDDHQIHAVNKVQSDVLYPAFDPDIPWDKMEPTLGMRYETPYQLKLALANYGVAYGNKDRVMKNKVRSGVQIGVKKKVVKKKVLKKKVVKKKPVSDSEKGTIRKNDQSYGVNLQHKVCQCRMWELNGVPYVHDVTDYLHCGIEIDLGVSHWTNDVPPLPPLVRRMPGRPQKSRIKAPGETSGSHTSRVGYCASRGRGRGRGGSENEANVSGMGGINEASGRGRGGTGGRGRRGRGMESSVGGKEVVVEEYQLQRMKRHLGNAWKNKPENKQKMMLNKKGVWVKDTTDVTTEYVDEFHGMETSETTNVAEEIGSAMEEKLPAPAVDKGKGVASVAQQDSAPKKKRGRPPSHVDGVRIYHKNRGRSKRIAKMKEKKAFEFDKHGTGSTPDKAFDVSD
ncbi:hypothetical protein Tco_0265683 [Tanacetum coccineum]